MGEEGGLLALAVPTAAALAALVALAALAAPLPPLPPPRHSSHPLAGQR